VRREPIGPVFTPREARARREAQRWAEGRSDLHGTALLLLEHAVACRAEGLGRDLDSEEVDRACRGAVASFVHAEQQRLAQEAIAGTREIERIDYLRRTAAFARLTADTPPKGLR
jgi:hypothetical protein